MTLTEQKRILKDVKATMAMEGMPLTEQNIRDGLAILNKKTTVEELARQTIDEYRRTNNG